jgi:hypothetical protein
MHDTAKLGVSSLYCLPEAQRLEPHKVMSLHLNHLATVFIWMLVMTRLWYALLWLTNGRGRWNMVAGKEQKVSWINRTFSVVTTLTQHSVNYLFPSSGKVTLTPRQINHNETSKTSNTWEMHPPSTRMTIFQKGVHYMGVKIFNKLPPKIQHLSNNKKQFHKTLKNFYS